MILLLSIIGLAALVGIIMLRARARYFYVLRAIIVAHTPEDYSVSFQRLHPEAQPIEHVWLCLLLAAKLLYIMGKDPNQQIAVELLMDFIHELGDTDLSDSPDVVWLTGDQIRLVKHDGIGGCTITAEVAYISAARRSLWTSIPKEWFGCQFPHTFIAVLASSLPGLEPYQRTRLQGGLARMAELYDEGVDPASMKALAQVPLIAFLNPKFPQ